jgi:CheY-like chemotaxis protein
MTNEQPLILIIDDRPEEIESYREDLQGKASTEVMRPSEIVLEQLDAADLVLIDYKLESWPTRDNLSEIGLRPMDGLALAAVLRAHTYVARKPDSPTAFGILSAHLRELAGDLPPRHREHVIARAHNLEWVFEKSSHRPDLVRQFSSLADAVRRLPQEWPVDSPEETRLHIRSLLALPDADWSERAFEEVEGCHPPIHELSEWTHGLEVLRWLLHRIFPYPCFLFDTRYLAARLRVTHSSLIEALDSKLGAALRPVQYSGILFDFPGKRWWRSGVESWLWEVTDQQSFDVRAVRAALKALLGHDLSPSIQDEPVLCLDSNLEVLNEFADARDAVRLQPDDWPPYADQAWATIKVASEDPVMRALVIERDRYRLGIMES